MKKIVNIVVTLAIIGLIGFGIYKLFIDGERLNSFFDREVTLEVWDQVSVSDEVTIKLIKVKDDRCMEETCEREGQFLANFLVFNSKKIAYIELGELEPSELTIDKLSLEYKIELVDVSDDGKSTTIKVNKG